MCVSTDIDAGVLKGTEIQSNALDLSTNTAVFVFTFIENHLCERSVGSKTSSKCLSFGVKYIFTHYGTFSCHENTEDHCRHIENSNRVFSVLQLVHRDSMHHRKYTPPKPDPGGRSLLMVKII